MQSKDLRDDAKSLVTQAEAAITSGEAEQAEKLVAGAKEKFATADSLDASASKVKEMTDTWGDEGVQRVPVASEDVKKYNPNDTGAKTKADHKPATWVKGIPSMAQPLWVQDAMGDNLKEEAKFQKDAFVQWMTAPSADIFYKTASSDVLKAMEEGTDNEGGYFVPEEFINNVVHDTGLPSGEVRAACNVIRVASKDGYVPTLANATWGAIAEEASFSDQTPTVGQVAFSVKKSGGLIKVTRELLDDSAINLPSMLAQIFQEAAGRDEEIGILGGGGSTNYLGVLDAAAGISDYLMASPTAIVAADLFGIFYTLQSQHRANAGWVMPSLISKDINGINATSAGVHSVNDLNTPPADFLLGKRVINSDIAGTGLATAITASAEIGVFGDFRQYYIFDRIGFSIRRNDSLYMENDQVGFFATRRGDGRVALAAAFKILKAAAS